MTCDHRIDDIDGRGVDWGWISLLAYLGSFFEANLQHWKIFSDDVTH